MSLDEFIKRHYLWDPDKDKEVLLDQVMDCLKESKKRLSIDVRGNVIHAKVDPEHFVEDLIARFIAKQFSDYYVVLESERGTFVTGGRIPGVLKTKVNINLLVKELDQKKAVEV